MIFIPLFAIPFIFLVVAILKPWLSRHTPFHPCAICASVTLTWLSLLGLWFFGYTIDTVLIGVLMGMSVTGIMYKIENAYKRNSLKHLWIARLLILLGGCYSIVFLLREQWRMVILIGVASLIALIIISFLMQKVTYEDALLSTKSAGIKRSMIDRLDNCC